MARAVCRDCGKEWTGDLEEVSDAVDDHEQFHDVDIQRVATDGGHPPGNGGASVPPDPQELAGDILDHPPGKPHHCDICDTYFAEIPELVDHACEEHDDELVTDGGQNRRMPDGDTLAAGLLEDTADLVADDRDTHGDAVENQQHIAEAWTWYLRGHGLLSDAEILTGADVARMMMLVKLSRGAVGEYDIDHDRDVAGYAGIAAACEVHTGRAGVDEVLPDDYDDETVTDGAGHVLVRQSRSRSGRIYHHPHPDDPDAPQCRDEFPDSQLSSAGYRRRDPATLAADYRLCKRCDPEYTRDAGGGSKDHFMAAVAAGQEGDG
jgi:hypothetical protein